MDVCFNLLFKFCFCLVKLGFSLSFNKLGDVITDEGDDKVVFVEDEDDERGDDDDTDDDRFIDLLDMGEKVCKYSMYSIAALSVSTLDNFLFEFKVAVEQV